MRSLLARFSPSLGKMLGSPSLLGIDAGAWSAKCVKALPTDRGVHFERFVQATSASDLKKLVDENHFAGSRTAFSIADEKIESHEFTLPKLEKKELETAIEWEIKKTVASPDYVFHDVLTFENPEGYRIQCIVAAKDIVQGRFAEGTKAGVKPEFLETESSALLSCARHLSPRKSVERLAIVDLGYSSFRLIFVHENRVSFTRSLYFGLGSVAGQAATQLSVAVEDLLPILPTLQPGQANGPLAAGLERYVQESLYTLCEEFRRSEFFGRDQKGLADIEDVVLCGGGACIPAAVEYLRHHLPDKKIETLNPLRGVKSLPVGISESSGPLWACAVGLAVRETA